MVNLWPFGRDSNDAASFEKILSQLSTKINKATAQNERFRQRQRRYKVLWTLYTTFTYILVAAILTLVTGWDQWGAVEYSVISGSPVLIYAVRTALDAYYNYRIANSQNHVNDLNKQRDAAIEKLKAATKYNSTQQLLEKYGGSPPMKRQSSPQSKGKGKSEGAPQQGSKSAAPQGGRTGFAPPPTANIPSRQPSSAIAPQSGPGPNHPNGLVPPGLPPSPDQIRPGEEFAPNAFTRPPTLRQASQYATEGPKWYDRILDVVLGDDETQAKNRIVLICQNCKLVNGQAPPGARTLEDIGKWRCSACHAMNGVESEEKRIMRDITGAPSSPAAPVAEPEAEVVVGEEFAPNAGDDDEDQDDDTPAASTRSKARQRKA